jgi:hypothetical protein
MNCLRSLDRTMGSWVRIPLKAWMSAFSLYLCCIVRPRSPTDCLRIKKLKWNKAFQRCPIIQNGSNRKKRESGGVWKLISVSLLPTLPLHFKFWLSAALYSSSLCCYRRTFLYALVMLFTGIRPTWVLCFGVHRVYIQEVETGKRGFCLYEYFILKATCSQTEACDICSYGYDRALHQVLAELWRTSFGCTTFCLSFYIHIIWTKTQHLFKDSSNIFTP